jgi:glucose-1-phosphate cytidylyltransferase
LGTVTGAHPTSRYGEIHVSGDAVTEFNEKPTLATGWVSGGFFLFDRVFVDKYLDDDEHLMLEKRPLQQLARDGGLTLFPHEGFWMGMDTFRDWTELNALWDAGEAPWKVWD